MLSRILLLGITLALASCADQPTFSAKVTEKKAATSWCCLVDPEHGSLLMPDTKTSRSSLESWVNRNASHLSITRGAKPRFILIHVGSDLHIKDQMPLADQRSPGAAHHLTSAEVAALRACFAGGKKVKIDWVHKSIQLL